MTDAISYEELEEIIELLKNVSDYDLTGYTKSSLKRRVQRVMSLNHLSLFDLKDNIINTPGFQSYLVKEITVNVTEMFRDPAFYNELNSRAISYLRTYPQIKVWSAGCSTGEEVYSLAILLEESNLYDRSFIYGTDVNPDVIQVAKKGIYNIEKIKLYTDNFNAFDSDHSFTKYYLANYDRVTVINELKRNILFSVHNLATDSVFNEFHLITCRNVLIYFDISLQNKVIELLYDSLAPLGFLCLGMKEAVTNKWLKERFRVVSKTYNIYQKN